MVDNGKWQVLELEHHPEPRGSLTAVNDITKFPFRPGRVFWLSGLEPGHQRGSHAHKSGVQAFCVVSGKAMFSLYNQQSQHEVIVLDRPNQLIVLGAGVWVTMLEFAPGTAILGFADTVYDEADYLRDWDGFLAYRAPVTVAAAEPEPVPAAPASVEESTPPFRARRRAAGG